MDVKELYVTAGIVGDYRYRRFLEWLVIDQGLLSWKDGADRMLVVTTDEVMQKWQGVVSSENHKNKDVL